MKSAIVIIALASFVCANEDKSLKNSTNASNSTEEEHSETHHIPTYVLVDSGLSVETPKQYVGLHPETPIYSSVYTVNSSPHLKPATYVSDYGDNYIDHEYNSILSLTHNIPGIPGTDYPLYAAVPYTGFNCHDVGPPGFYADVAAGCQVWHYCQPDGRHDAFLCPNGTIFDQKNRVCNWWYNVHCQDSQFWYAINDDLYRIPKKKNVLHQYYDQYYSASKVIETKTDPPGTQKPKINQPIKMHPAVIVKIPKQPYRYVKERSSSELSPSLIRNKDKLENQNA